MSNRAINAVMDFSQSKGDDRVLMFVVADGISKDTGAYPARISTLMRQCNRAESTVHRHVNRCVRLGELVVLDGVASANTFYIPILPGEAGYAPEECDGLAHSCNGYHTPLHVDRESIAASAVKAARSQRKSQRRGARNDTPEGARNDTPLENDASGVPGMTPPGARNDTPPSQEWHPPVSAVAPNTHIDTLSVTPIDYQGHQSITLDKPEDADTDLHPAPAAWTTALRNLSATMTPAQLSTWLRPGKLFDGPAGYVLVFQTATQAEQVSNRYLDRIRRELGAPVELRVKA